MLWHNSKYYVPSLKRNKVKSLDIRDPFTKKSKQTDKDDNESEKLDGILFACSAKYVFLKLSPNSQETPVRGFLF